MAAIDDGSSRDCLYWQGGRRSWQPLSMQPKWGRCGESESEIYVALRSFWYKKNMGEISHLVWEISPGIVGKGKKSIDLKTVVTDTEGKLGKDLHHPPSPGDHLGLFWWKKKHQVFSPAAADKTYTR